MAQVGTAFVDVQADLAPFFRDVQSLGRDIGRTRVPPLSVGADTTPFTKDVADLGRTLQRTNLPNLNVNADTTGFKKEVAAVGTQLSRTNLPNLNVNADTSGFQREVAGLGADLGRKNLPDVKVDADTAGFNREVKQSLDTAEGRFKGLGGTIKTAFAGLGAAAATGGLGALVKGVVGAASDIQESLSKNQVLFGRYAKDVATFSETSAKSFGISRKSALEYTGVFGNLFNALGVTKDKSAEMSVELTQLAADMASFNNTSPEEALEAIRSGLVGETEPLRKFGVNINDATLRAEALRLGLIKSTKEGLDPQTKALAASSLITKQTAAAHGDFARTSEGLANQQRILGAEVSDIAAKIGTALLPAAIGVTRAFSSLLNLNFGNLVDSIRSVIDGSPALKAVGTAVGIIASAWVAYSVATKIAAIGQATLNLVMTANPIVLVVVAIAALAAGLVYAYTKSEAFRGAVDSMFGVLKTMGAYVAGAATAAWEKFGGVIEAFGTNYLKTLIGVVQGITRSLGGLVDFIAGVFTGDWSRAWQGIQDIFGGAFGAIKSIATGALTNLGLVFKTWLIAAGALFSGAWDAIRGVAVAAWNAIVSAITAYLNLLLTGIKTYVGLWQTYITTAWNVIQTATTVAWNAIQAAVLAPMRVLDTLLRALIGGIDTVVRAAWAGIAAVTTATWIAIREAVLVPLRAARDLGDIVLTGILNRVTGIWETIKKATSDAWNAVRDFVLDAIRSARDLLEVVLQGIFNRVQGMWSDVKTATGNAWAAIRDAVLDAVRFARDHIEDILQGIFNRVQGAFENIVTAAKRFGTAVGEAILDAMSGAGRAVQGVINKIIDVVNKVLSFVGAGTIGKIAIFAQGGTMDSRSADAVQYLARGGKITRPMAIVGEEAPRHPEYIIPTNPAYRPRAMDLFAKLGSELGVPGYFKGGVLGAKDVAMIGDRLVPMFAQGGVYSKAELVALAKSVGVRDPNLMAAVALAESAGKADAFGPPSGRGLWQIEWNVWAGHMARLGLTNPEDPRQNARMMKEVLDQQGIRAWVAYNNGSYQAFMGAGGGVIEAVGDAISDIASTVSDFIGGLPGLSDLPDWIRPVGSFVIDKVKDWIGDKVSSFNPFADDGSGGTPSGTASIAAKVAKQFGLRITSGYRDPAHNAAVGGVAGSLHTHGSPSNPGAVDLVGPFPAMMAAKAWAQANLQLKELLVHDVGSGLHLHLGFFNKGGTLDKMGFDEDTPVLPFVGAYKTGGIVPQDGMAYVHKDETIIPASGQAAVPVHLVVDVNDGEFARAIHVRQVAAGRKATAQFHAGRLRP